MTYAIGDVVRVRSGRESGQLMRIVGISESFLLLANGKNRTVESPKRKSPKHVIAVMTRTDSETAMKLRRGETIRNSELRRDLAMIGQEKADKDQGGMQAWQKMI